MVLNNQLLSTKIPSILGDKKSLFRGFSVAGVGGSVKAIFVPILW